MEQMDVKQAVELITTLMNSNQNEKALNEALKVFKDSKRLNSQLLMLLYRLYLQQNNPKEAAFYLLYLAFESSKLIDRMLTKDENRFFQRADDFAASLGYAMILNEMWHGEKWFESMTDDTQLDYIKFVNLNTAITKKSLMSRKICAPVLAKFEGQAFRSNAISQGSSWVFELFGYINSGHENKYKLRFMNDVYKKSSIDDFHANITRLSKICERYDLYLTTSDIHADADRFITSFDRSVFDSPSTTIYALTKKVENALDRGVAYSRYQDAVKYSNKILKHNVLPPVYAMRAQAYEARDEYRLAFNDYCAEVFLRAYRYEHLKTGDDRNLIKAYQKAVLNMALAYVLFSNHYKWSKEKLAVFAFAVKFSKASLASRTLLMQEYLTQFQSPMADEYGKLLQDESFKRDIYQLGLGIIDDYLIPLLSRSNYGWLPDNFKNEILVNMVDKEYFSALDALKKMPAFDLNEVKG